MGNSEIQKRTRKNQPTGYYGNNHSNDLIIEYYCEKHDYFYYPENWTDDKTKWHYEKGYYDEEGKYYSDKNLVFDENGVFKKDIVCTKCNKLNTDVLWSEDSIPSCKECGDSFEEEFKYFVSDKIVLKVETNNPQKQKKQKRIQKTAAVIIILAVIAGVFVLLNVLGIINLPKIRKPIVSETIYIDNIERECKYIEQFGCYYDPETDCFFRGFNVDDKEEWEYWYYDISSEYGKYGWMKYIRADKSWMIEVSKDNWQPLPESVDTSELWHK